MNAEAICVCVCVLLCVCVLMCVCLCVPADLWVIVTSLYMCSGATVSCDVSCVCFCYFFSGARSRFFGQSGWGRESVLRRFQERSSSVRGRKVVIDENDGFEGVTDGLDERGFLRVRTAQGLRVVLSGDGKNEVGGRQDYVGPGLRAGRGGRGFSGGCFERTSSAGRVRDRPPRSPRTQSRPARSVNDSLCFW